MACFSEILGSLRRESGLSQRKAAQELGVSQALLSHYENGAREPRLEFVSRVCAYYGVTADYILGRSDGEVTIKRCPDGAETLIDSVRDIFTYLYDIGDDELTKHTLEYLGIPIENVRGLLHDPDVLYDPLRDAEFKPWRRVSLQVRATHEATIHRTIRSIPMINQDNIRNFSIIAHIDHGKSTLADRLLERCGAIDERDMENQILDNMELERERGITIKARAVGLNYTAKNGETYRLNLIDTPGHVDFNYEVSRSLAACEGAVLVVDAAQGVEAQTLANTYLALDHNLEILPVINKIDLPAADPKRVKTEIEDIIGLPAEDAPEISAKRGIGIDEVLEGIVAGIPAPKGDPDAPLRALIFDSQYDAYRGVIVFIRILDGVLKSGMDIKMMATGAEYRIVEAGHLRPVGMEPCDELTAGDVGYITASIKNVADTQVGDTVTAAERPATEPLPGYKSVRSMVFSGIYTADGAKYPDLRDALEKLKLNDASLSYEPESSVALGFGFRCGFLGLLHMEIIQERLEREYNLDLITTAPSVIYRVTKTDGTVVMVDNPLNYPDPVLIEQAEEPFIKASIISPAEYVGNIMDLCQDRRGDYKEMVYLDKTRVELKYELPLGEVIYDFFDALKSRTRGYASLDYELSDYRLSHLVRLDILLNNEIVDALSFIVHRDKAYERGRRIAEKLKENIPRQLFEIPVQAAIGGKIIARETIKALRKDVLAKCYGGDITRKKKLLEKQKEGKKRMRNLGSVAVPQEAFMAVLKLDE